MDWQTVLLDFLPLIIFVLLLLFVLRQRMNRVIPVYMISAFKTDFPDRVEMKVSPDKAEIDEWEKTFRNTGYRVSRQTDEIKVSLTRLNRGVRV